MSCLFVAHAKQFATVLVASDYGMSIPSKKALIKGAPGGGYLLTRLLLGGGFWVRIVGSLGRITIFP